MFLVSGLLGVVEFFVALLRGGTVLDSCRHDRGAVSLEDTTEEH